MITLVVRNRLPLLGELKYEPKPFVEYSQLGQEIRHGQLPRITYHYPMVEIYRHCLMPDHIHLILGVKENMDTHLGQIIAGFKSGCNGAYYKLYGAQPHGLFEDGYCDKLICRKDQIKAWKNYLSDNPRRLAVKRQNPDLFTVRQDITIVDCNCQMVGNRYLLSNPDKMAVVVHRGDNDDVYNQKIRQWMACGERGGVLVGTGIAERERWVMRGEI